MVTRDRQAAAGESAAVVVPSNGNSTAGQLAALTARPQQHADRDGTQTPKVAMDYISGRITDSVSRSFWHSFSSGSDPQSVAPALHTFGRTVSVHPSIGKDAQLI